MKFWSDKDSEAELLGNYQLFSRLFAKRATAGGKGPDFLSCTRPAHCRRGKKKDELLAGQRYESVRPREVS